MPFSKVYRVLHKTGNPHSVLLESREFEEGLLLESGTIVSLSPVEKDEIKSGYVKALDAYGCLGAIKFPDDASGTRQSFYIVLVTACMSVGRILDSEIFRITGVCFYSLANGSVEGNSRCSDLKKLLSSGKFYFSWSSTEKGRKDPLDLTVCLQNQGQQDEQERFFWNRLMHVHFKHFGISCELWLFRIISGGIDIKTVYVGAQQAKAMIISRLSCERAGTRYNVRGVNDEGNVANFVESEQVIVIGDNISSFMQVRGSIPLFWGQPGLNVGSHKVQMARGFEATAPTYHRHLMKLVEIYGQCIIVNLLGTKEGENMLSKMFQSHHKESSFKDSIPFYCFDYHAECRGGKSDNLSRLKSILWDKMEEIGCYTKRNDQNLRLTQSGVVRFNCLDCLDRTNSTKTYFGLQMLPKQLEHLGLGGNKQLEDRFREAFKTAWPVTGDLISRMYAGTGALEGKTKFKDGARSVSRAIQNNFLDQNKQNAIDLLIHGTNSLDVEVSARASNLLSGDCLQAPAVILKEMCNKYKDFSAEMPVRVAIGTWNVNGGKHFRSRACKDQTLDDWLLNFNGNKEQSPEKYRALYDFSGGEDGDLCFASGDVIHVHEVLPDGEWMSGQCNGMSGIFPVSYVAKIYPTYKALFDFPAQQEGDLGFVAGDIIEVTDMSGDWWKGKVKQDDYDPDQPVGIFPASYVKQCGETYDDSCVSSPSSVDWNKPIDIYAIGFQEMVELSAGNIVNTSMTNHDVWAEELEKTLSVKYKYILLASEQLVGVCLYVFIRPQHAPHIRDLEIATVKTGMGGATGNKGGIGIRMQFYNSSVCFVCSHLAAGQGQVHDRNSDFAEITKKMIFNGNKDMYCHDYVFWCGDLNYRIDMPNTDVKDLVEGQDWSALREYDQLYIEKKEKRVFSLFKEGETNFAPTYKYDLFTDVYDTSEKCRTPAWTDRVLWFRRQWFAEKQGSDDLVSVSENFDFGRLLYYDRAEIKTSDHRPVIAVLDIDVLQCAEEHLDETFDEIVAAQGPPDASVIVSLSETKDDIIPMDESLRRAILAELGNLGEIILTRQLKNKLLIIFKEGSSALQAFALNGATIHGVLVYITLKSSKWKEDVEHELRHRSLSASFNDSYMNKHDEETVHYDYPPDAFDNAYDENQNYAGADVDYSIEPHEKAQFYIETHEAYIPGEVEPLENVSEDLDDPGWACESISIFQSHQEVSQSVLQHQKAPVPPRPLTRPVKKQAPPRPGSLPTLPSGPPPKPSGTTSSTNSFPTVQANSTAGILIPERAPLPRKPPKITPRTTVPKRRAPAPPPGKALLQTKPRSQSYKPKRAPPIPTSVPKGPPRTITRPKASSIQSTTRSAPNLLDFDPLGSVADDPGSGSRADTLMPTQALNGVKGIGSSESRSVPQRTSSTPIEVFQPLQNSSDLFGQPFFTAFQSNSGSAKSSGEQMRVAARLKPVSITPPPPSSRSQTLKGNPGSYDTSHDFNSLKNMSAMSSIFKDQASTLPRQPTSSQNSKPSATAFADDWLNLTLSQAASPNVLQNSNTWVQGVQFQQKPLTPTKPLQPGISAMQETTVFRNGSFQLQPDDPFGMSSFSQPLTAQSKPQNDPWGFVDSKSTIPASFSTDFSNLNMK